MKRIFNKVIITALLAVTVMSCRVMAEETVWIAEETADEPIVALEDEYLSAGDYDTSDEAHVNAGEKTESVDGYTLTYKGTTLKKAEGTGERLNLSRASVAYTVIEKQAFKNNSKLKRIIFPESLTTIEYEAFAGCKALEGTITIPDSVTSIESGAFADCVSVNEVHLSKNLDKLGSIPFYGSFIGCRDLTKVTNVGDIRSVYGGEKGDPFYGCLNLKYIEWRDDIKKIPDYIFAETGLTEVKIPATAVTIGASAFEGCRSLKTLDFADGNSLMIINANAFNDDTALSQVHWNKLSKLQKIRNSAFGKCKALSGKLSIPNSVEEIGGSAFAQCSGITEIRLPDSLKTLGASERNGAFIYCTSLTTLSNLGDIETSYGREGASIIDNPIYGCTALKDVRWKDGINKTPDYILKYWENIEELKVPETVTEIGQSSFDRCSKLSSVTIPATCIKVDENAFAEDNAIKKVVFGGTKEAWDKLKEDSGDGNDPLWIDEVSSSADITFEGRVAVIFRSKGGSSLKPRIIDKGSKTAKPDDPKRDGYNFSGWYTDEACTSAYDFNLPVNSTIVLYAGWSKGAAPAPGDGKDPGDKKPGDDKNPGDENKPDDDKKPDDGNEKESEIKYENINGVEVWYSSSVLFSGAKFKLSDVKVFNIKYNGSYYVLKKAKFKTGKDGKTVTLSVRKVNGGTDKNSTKTVNKVLKNYPFVMDIIPCEVNDTMVKKIKVKNSELKTLKLNLPGKKNYNAKKYASLSADGITIELKGCLSGKLKAAKKEQDNQQNLDR